MKLKSWLCGVINMAAILPVYNFAILWGLLVMLAFGIGVMHYDTVPDWLVIIGLIPMLISPLMGIGGVVYGIVRRRERLSWLGILLSALCLIVNVLLWYAMYYLGSHY